MVSTEEGSVYTARGGVLGVCPVLGSAIFYIYRVGIRVPMMCLKGGQEVYRLCGVLELPSRNCTCVIREVEVKSPTTCNSLEPESHWKCDCQP